jgi:hypothetical protein
MNSYHIALIIVGIYLLIWLFIKGCIEYEGRIYYPEVDLESVDDLS